MYVRKQFIKEVNKKFQGNKNMEIGNMLTIRKLNKVNPKYIESIAKLHKKAFPAFFLTQLGVPFLQTLYTCYVKDKNSGIIVVEKNNRIIGFIAYSNDYPQFYKGLLKNHLVKFALYSAGAAIRHPLFIKRLLGAFKKSNSVVKEERYVELASICVEPSIESKGIGSSLIDYLKSIVDFNIYAYINLETDAENNTKAIRFYEKNGFKRFRVFKTQEGRKMIEYRYYNR